MTSLDIGIAAVRAAAHRLRRASHDVWRRGLARWLNSVLPKGLYARALLIIILPMVILQSVVAFVFMERHWSLVTQRLSAGVVADIAALIDVYNGYPQDADQAQIRRIAQERLGLVVDFLPLRRHAAAGAEAVLLAARPDAVGGDPQADRQAVLDRYRRQVGAGRDPRAARQHGAARLRAPQRRLRVEFADLPVLDGRHRLVLLTVAILFLRNQIRPILRLADAAESFGKGREVPNFRPRGAREVRRAAAAFIEMKTRIERAIEQRTAMLAGVSHDLRTVLTRFKLELALIGEGPEVEAMKRDVDEMARMLEDYLAFARGDRGEGVGADRHGGPA